MKHTLLMALSALAFSTTLPAASLVEDPMPDPAGLAINRGRMIPFEHPLPRMKNGKAACGLYNNPEWSVPGLLSAQDSRLGLFLQRLRETITANRRLLFIDGKVIVCNHNWIRDHVQQMKGWMHWERDPLTFLQFIIDTQRPDGQYYELVKQLDDVHWKFVPRDCRILYPEDNLSLVRLELEADVEFLVVEGAMHVYRMTGDNRWLASVLPRLEKGIDYQTSDPKRWDAETRLCIRPYTIDTWDFTTEKRSSNDRSIHPDETMCAMHGDNTGVYQAMSQLAWFNDRLGHSAKASEWRRRAETLKADVMKTLWNGRFFVHQYPVRGGKALDAHEAERLSLSDAYALNRGMLSPSQCRSVVDEFQERRKTTKAFAEFFSIDPAYAPKFKEYLPGQYVNGGISPFTAGELAKGAFACGRETYAWDILQRFEAMLESDGEIYFLYDPITRKALGGGPSAWGAAALMDAVDKGLAGIVDAGTGYDVIDFSPRWPVTHYREIRYATGYELTGKYVDCRGMLTDAGLRYHLRSPARMIKAHILLPDGKRAAKLLVNGVETKFETASVDHSLYVEATVTPANGVADFEVLY